MATDETRAEASNPSTEPARLQELTNDPELWALIAANPNAYDSLLAWLDQVGGPDVKAALAARGGGQPTAVQPPVGQPTTPPPSGLPQPGGFPPPAGVGHTGAGSSGSNNKVLWIVLGVVAFLLVAGGGTAAAILLTKGDGDSTKDDKETTQDDDSRDDKDSDSDKDSDKDDDKKNSDDLDCDALEDLYDAASDLTLYYPDIDDESDLDGYISVIEEFEGHDNKEVADAVDDLLAYADYVKSTGDGGYSDEWSDALDAEFAISDLIAEEC